MKRDLITKHPLLPESKHMLYCTYAPHLLYSQAHIRLMHTQSHLPHSATHAYLIHVAHRLCFGSRGFTLHCTNTFWPLAVEGPCVHCSYSTFSSSRATHPVTEMQKSEMAFLLLPCGQSVKEQESATAAHQQI